MTTRNSTRRWTRLLALLLGLSMFAAACGDDDDNGEGATPDDNGTETDTENGVESSPEDAEGDPVIGGDLTYALEAETNGGFCLPEAQLAPPRDAGRPDPV